MKYKLFLTLALVIAALSIWAQAPQGLNYQAVARNTQGAVLASQAVGIQFSLLSGSPTGTAVYVETNTATTNQFGLFTSVIGSGTATTGTLAGVNWGAGPIYLQVALDLTGGTTYTNYGAATQLQSVPYALYAGNSPWVTSGNNIYNGNTGYVGIGTTNPAHSLDVLGANFDAARFASNDASGTEIIISNSGNDLGGLAYAGFDSTVALFSYGATDISLGVNNLGTQIMRLKASNGYVGIGTKAPTQMLSVAGNAIFKSTGSLTGIWLGNPTDSSHIWSQSSGLALDANSSGSVGVYIDIANNRVEPEVSALTNLGSNVAYWKAVYSTNGAIQTSDERKKKNITNLNIGLNEVMALRPVAYEWRNPADGDGGQIGFIAQEVEKVVPQAVVHDYISDAEVAELKARNKAVPEIRDPYAMKYTEMIPVLTKAIQQQQAMILKLQQQVEQLQKAK